jgi:mono/diheme cytochrome c family protein
MPGAFLPSRRILVWCLAVVLSGCGSPDREFRANAVYLKRQESVAQTTLTAQQKRDLVDILTTLFGTPDEPRLPTLPDIESGAILDLEQLRVVAGPTRSDETGQAFGLYRAQCANCHGISGDGAGPAATFLNPYPRDFRRGTFKFKSTAGPGTPPTDEDLKRILENGIPGTAMPAFRLMLPDEIEALVQYVKYLAIRGEVERVLIARAVDELGSVDRLVDFSLADRRPTKLAQQWAAVYAEITPIMRRWRDAPQHVTPVPERPDNWDLSASIARGRELFLGNVANCVKCHGKQGLGDGQTTDYDDWTKEFLDPQNPASAQPHTELGALPPRNIRPRNLRQGVFHGGMRPTDLYWRIHNGIAGTPMPAASMKSPGVGPEDQRLSSDDVWHLIDYVTSLRTETSLDY